jgi:predicted MPP superfamily phosphohydrolase
VVVASLFLEIINIIYVKLYRKEAVKSKLWNSFFCSGLLPVIFTVLILGYGYFNMQDVMETHYTVHTSKAIRQKGYRIALIADLHSGTTMNENTLKKYCNKIEKNKPDLVVLCGDIVDERTTLKQMKAAANILGHIKSSYGTFYVYGNHDKNTYSSKPNYSVEKLTNELKNNKIHVIEDGIYKLNNEFTVIGRKDRGFSSENSRKTCKALLKNVNKNSFLLLLDHQPSELKGNSKLGIDLQLSGHTHGGQIWPTGLLGFGDLIYGYEKIGRYQVIVTSGLGGWGYPIRTGSHSEYVIVDVKR